MRNKHTNCLFRAHSQAAWNGATIRAWRESDSYEKRQLIAENGTAIIGSTAMRDVFSAAEKEAAEYLDKVEADYEAL